MWAVPASQFQRVASSAAAQALFAGLAGEGAEVLGLAYLGTGQQLLGLRHVRSTAHDRLALPIRDIAADALAFDARALVMAHNHPSGDPRPSPADCETTRLVVRALEALHVRVLDHLIVARLGVTSLRALGLL